MPEREFKTFQVPPVSAQSESMGRSPKPFIVACAVFMFLSLGLMFTVIFVFANAPKIGVSAHKLEFKQAWEVGHCLREAATERKFQQWAKRNPALRGEQFWARALRDQVIDQDMLHKLCALTGPDMHPHREGFLSQTTKYQAWCSYTSPIAVEVEGLFAKEKPRCVVVCFNARNWNNRPDLGVMVIWSDSEEPQWLTFEQARADWGITAEQWADPAGQLFGKKAPFQHTYE